VIDWKVFKPLINHAFLKTKKKAQWGANHFEAQLALEKAKA